MSRLRNVIGYLMYVVLAIVAGYVLLVRYQTPDHGYKSYQDMSVEDLETQRQMEQAVREKVFTIMNNPGRYSGGH